MTRSEPSIVTRALGLITMSVVLPVVSVLLMDIVLLQLKLTDVHSLAFYAFIAAGALSIHLPFRRKPNYWRFSSVVVSVLLVIFVATLLFPLGDNEPTYEPAGPVVVAVVTIVTGGLVVLNYMLSDEAKWLVLTDLSDDIVNSSLVIAFKSRADKDTLHVTPNSIHLLRSKRSRDSTTRSDDDEVSYALADVSAVTVRRQGSWLEYYPVPRMEIREMRVTKGDYVEIDLSDGTLVFPAEDCQRFARFVEDRRRALARDE